MQPTRHSGNLTSQSLLPSHQRLTLGVTPPISKVRFVRMPRVFVLNTTCRCAFHVLFVITMITSNVSVPAQDSKEGIENAHAGRAERSNYDSSIQHADIELECHRVLDRFEDFAWNESGVQAVGFDEYSGSERPFTTDRPQFTESSQTLIRGRLQIEGGYTLNYDDEDDIRLIQHFFPDLMVRYSLTDDFEIRGSWPGIIFSHFTDDLVGDSGSFDDGTNPNVGFKLALWDQRDAIPQTALSASAPIETDGAAFSLPSLQPIVDVLYSWAIDDRLIVSGSTGVALLRANGDDFFDLQQSVSADYLITKRYGAYAEWIAFFRHKSAVNIDQYLADIGVYYLVTEHLQIDGRVGVGLNDVAPDFFTGVGFSYRF